MKTVIGLLVLGFGFSVYSFSSPVQLSTTTNNKETITQKPTNY
jgi:hypothetical protein